MTERLPIDKASLAQLKQFAAGRLKIKLSPNPNVGREKILEAIRREWEHDFIEFDADAQGATAPEPKAVPEERAKQPVVKDTIRRLDTDSSKDPRITIELHVLPGNGPQSGDRPVPVGVNGKHMLIPRGKPVTIPYRFYLGLREAVRTEYEMRQDPITKQEDIVSHDVQSFPFNVIQAPPLEEVLAWFRDSGRRVPDWLLEEERRAA